jgi:hypothetical protein
LFGNLGDDWIAYDKEMPPAEGAAGRAVVSTLYLVGSPAPDELAASLKSVLIFLSREAERPAERDYLGRKVFSVPLPSFPLPTGGASGGGAVRQLHYAAVRGYLVLSTDHCLLEEFLRMNEHGAPALRDLPGLASASQRVLTPACGTMGFTDRAATMKRRFDPGAATDSDEGGLGLVQLLLGLAAPEKDYRQWMDFGLLPGFASVKKYFNFSVYAASATQEGITWKFFEPTPPALLPESK